MRRVAEMEREYGVGEVIFTLDDGTKAGMRRKEFLVAVDEGITGKNTRRANLLCRAVKASNGSRMHEIVQALRAGPVPPGQVNE